MEDYAYLLTILMFILLLFFWYILHVLLRGYFFTKTQPQQGFMF